MRPLTHMVLAVLLVLIGFIELIMSSASSEYLLGNVGIATILLGLLLLGVVKREKTTLRKTLLRSSHRRHL